MCVIGRKKKCIIILIYCAPPAAVGASFFSMEKRSQKPSKGDTPFDIPLAPNADYLRHLALVLLLVWRINPPGLIMKGPQKIKASAEIFWEEEQRRSAGASGVLSRNDRISACCKACMLNSVISKDIYFTFLYPTYTACVHLFHFEWMPNHDRSNHKTFHFAYAYYNFFFLLDLYLPLSLV